jgi:hypothetical protein
MIPSVELRVYVEVTRGSTLHTTLDEKHENRPFWKSRLFQKSNYVAWNGEAIPK